MSEWLKYIDDDGYITMCRGCRLVKNPNDRYLWQLVAGWYDKHPENTKFTICPECRIKNKTDNL